jgi:ketosteroid isomerase-like protein
MRVLRIAAILPLLASSLPAQESARILLRRADLDFSALVYDSGAVATIPGAVGTYGVIVWPGGSVLQGTTAVTRFFARQPLLADAKLSWQPFRIEISPDSSLAIMTGVAVFDRPPLDPIAAIHRIGRFLEVWKREATGWKLAAFALVNLINTGETIWTDAIGPRELPPLRSTGLAAAFIAADSLFSAEAGASGVSRAFAKWAAPDATIFSGTGELLMGPAAIGASLATNTAHWSWGAVAAGASKDGMLGWTVGQATITPAGDGAPIKSKYLTLWRKMPDGTIRFIADGGNARP